MRSGTDASDSIAAQTNCEDDGIDDFVQLLQIGRVVLRNLEIIDVPFHLIPVLSDLIFLHPSFRLCRQRGGRDG